MTKEFKAKIESGERGRVFIVIPFDPKAVWDKQTRYYVSVVINNCSFSTSLGVKGGQYFFPFNKEMQEQTKCSAGDEVTVSISPVSATESPADDVLPADLLTALNQHKKAKAFFESLSDFYRNTYIKWVTSAKQEQTRMKRIEEMLQLLSEGKKQK